MEIERSPHSSLLSPSDASAFIATRPSSPINVERESGKPAQRIAPLLHLPLIGNPFPLDRPSKTFSRSPLLATEIWKPAYRDAPFFVSVAGIAASLLTGNGASYFYARKKMKSNEESILVVHDRWLEAELAQDMETLESLLHDDVLCLLPGGTRITGKGKCLDFFGGDSTKIEKIGISNIWVKAGAQLAVKVADFETRFVDHRIPVASGTHTWCLKKEAGEWKIQMMTWTIRGDRDRTDPCGRPSHTTTHTGP